MSNLKDSGTRRDFANGAVRDAQKGKGRFDLLPMESLWQLAKVYEAGASKYAARNWEKGINFSAFVDSGMRHLTKFMEGWEDEPHLVMAVWNFISLLETAIRVQRGTLPEELNDLPSAKFVRAEMLFDMNELAPEEPASAPEDIDGTF